MVLLTADNWTDIVFHISAAQNGAEFDPDNEFVEPYVVLFFVLIVHHIVLVIIVIAVLLDGFLNPMSEERQLAIEILEMQRDEHFSELLEPLTQFRSANDLTATMEEIYKKIDLDNSGQVSFMVCLCVCIYITHAYIHIHSRKKNIYFCFPEKCFCSRLSCR